MKNILSIILLTLTLFSCQSSYDYEDSSDYEDGTYCAEVSYYNDNTGTSSTYTLQVEIEDNMLTQIYWTNGGWLDDSHFTPPDISNGYATFTSDRGYEYSVIIIGNGDCDVSSNSQSRNGRSNENHNIIERPILEDKYVVFIFETKEAEIDYIEGMPSSMFSSGSEAFLYVSHNPHKYSSTPITIYSYTENKLYEKKDKIKQQISMRLESNDYSVKFNINSGGYSNVAEYKRQDAVKSVHSEITKESFEVFDSYKEASEWVSKSKLERLDYVY